MGRVKLPDVESIAISRPLFDALAESFLWHARDYPNDAENAAVITGVEFRSLLSPKLLKLLGRFWPHLREVEELHPEHIQAFAYLLSVVRKAEAKRQREQRAMWKRQRAEREAAEQRAASRAAARAAAKASAASSSFASEVP